MSPRDVIVTGVNLRAAENGEVHSTDRYKLVQEQETPILRRGQAFTVVVNFENGVFDPNHHTVAFVFTYVGVPEVNDRTKGVAIVGGDLRDGWKARAVQLENSSGLFKVESPSDAPVGEWKMKVGIRHQDGRNDFHYQGPIYFIFNPWNARESVHMPDTQLLDEYVVSDVGKIWTIAKDNLKGKQWIYGQYDQVALHACLRMLKDSGISPMDCRDPIKVCQAIMSMLNGKAGKGVTFGNWDSALCESSVGDPTVPCVDPDEWPGSAPILEQWMEGGSRPVKSGYSFVFAGLVTTVCRALGIPARNVTNVGHGVDLASDVTSHVEGGLNSNRVTEWPFHVWNEVYLDRPDLPQGYGGWQAIDGSPQFLSDGSQHYGPASVAAIKAGRRDLAYDVNVFITATNGDSQPRGGNGQTSTLNRNTTAVGKGLYTKKPYTYDPIGEEDRENIMDSYKSPEENKSEEISEDGGESDTTRPTTPQQIEVNMTQGMTVNLGESLPILFKVKNNSNDVKTLRAVMVADSTYQNGPKGHNLKTEEHTITLNPLQEQELAFTIHPGDCIGKLTGYGAVLAKLTVTSGPDVAASTQGISRFRLPEIVIQRPGPLTVNQQNSFRFSFRNPLNVPLTECKMYYYSPDIDIIREKPFRNVQPYEEVTMEEYFTPTTTSFSISMRFECKEIEFIHGRYEH